VVVKTLSFLLWVWPFRIASWFITVHVVSISAVRFSIMIVSIRKFWIRVAIVSFIRSWSWSLSIISLSIYKLSYLSIKFILLIKLLINKLRILMYRYDYGDMIWPVTGPPAARTNFHEAGALGSESSSWGPGQAARRRMRREATPPESYPISLNYYCLSIFIRTIIIQFSHSRLVRGPQPLIDCLPETCGRRGPERGETCDTL